MRKTPTACLLHKGIPWLNWSMDLINISSWKISALQNDWKKGMHLRWGETGYPPF